EDISEPLSSTKTQEEDGIMKTMELKKSVAGGGIERLQLTASQIQGRGWTKGMIEQFLGEPDASRPNPHYRSGPRMRLYEMRRVEQAVTSPEFREAQEARNGKREAAQKTLETKRQKIADYVATVTIDVPQLTDDELVRRACEHYNARRCDHPDFDC